MNIVKSLLKDVKIIGLNHPMSDDEMVADCVTVYRWDYFRKFSRKAEIPFFVDYETTIKQKHTLRGIYYNMPPRDTCLLIRCTRGSIYQVVVDFNIDSQEYLNWSAEELSEANQLQMFVPEGFGQAFLTLNDDVVIQYKSTNYITGSDRMIINYSDPLIGIDWPETPLHMSPIVKYADGVAAIEKRLSQLFWARKGKI